MMNVNEMTVEEVREQLVVVNDSLESTKKTIESGVSHEESLKLTNECIGYSRLLLQLIGRLCELQDSEKVDLKELWSEINKEV